jgi:Holliday junction DNA helicase RuvA
MIGRLRGQILLKHPPELVVDVNGVGYELQAPMSTFYNLPEQGASVSLYTHFIVREDAQVLYGFASESERSLFRELLKVNGVGAKTALAILSGMDAGRFARCIESGDAAALIRVPGVGRKTAERLIVEMRDRLSALPARIQQADRSAGGEVSPAEEAAQALIALGYKPAEAARMIERVASPELKSEQLIRIALQASLK